MEKINLNLTVSIDIAMKILAIMKENEQNCFEEIITDTPLPEIPPIHSITLDDIRHGFVELSKTKGKEVAKQVIANLGFKRVTEIPEDMFDLALSKVKEAM